MKKTLAPIVTLNVHKFAIYISRFIRICYSGVSKIQECLLGRNRIVVYVELTAALCLMLPKYKIYNQSIAYF